MQILGSFLLPWFSSAFSIPWLSWSYIVPFELVPFQLLPQVLGFLLYWSHIWVIWNRGCIFLWFSRIELFSLLIFSLSWLVWQNCPYNLPILLCEAIPWICCSSSFRMFLVSCIVWNTWPMAQIVSYLLEKPLSICHLLLSICCCNPK